MAATLPTVVNPVADFDYGQYGKRIQQGQSGTGPYVHTDKVYAALMNATITMENRVAESLANYQEHPDVQANLQQLQYDLQSWNLALSTMTNIQKNMADALKSISSNFR